MKGSEFVNELMCGLQRAIDYIEDNLCEELEISKIAARAYLSPFYFQRIFNATCGLTVGEYVRSRRLSLAGEELSRSDIRDAEDIRIARNGHNRNIIRKPELVAQRVQCLEIALEISLIHLNADAA